MTTMLPARRSNLLLGIAANQPAPAAMVVTRGEFDYPNVDSALSTLPVLDFVANFTFDQFCHSCGMCHKRFSTTCKCGVDLDGWYCRIPEGCGFFGSPCGFRHYEDNPFEAQIGGSCIEARTAIFAVWPGMTVICQAQSNPRPITRDTNRYIILLDDDTGVVTSIHFDLAPLTSCPVNPTSASGMPCDIPFEESCIQPGGSSFKRGTELCTRRASRCYCQELGGCGIAKLQCRVPFVDCVTLDPPAPRGSPP